MKKNIRNTIVSMILIILILQIPLMAFAAPNIPSATSDFYVNDFANIFTEDEKSGLMKRAVELANSYDGVQVVITTVKSLDGYTVEEYATTMYNKYGIGKDNMGLLILLSTEDRKIRVEVGKNMEAYINDSKAGRIMDEYAIPSLKENKFNEGLIFLQAELITEIKKCIDKSTTTSKEDTPIVIDWSAIIFWFLVILIFIIIGIIIFTIYNKSQKIKKLIEENQKMKSKMQSVKDDADEKIRQAQSKILEIQDQKQSVDKKYLALNEMFDTLKDRYKRGTVLYPELDIKIDAMIEEEIRQKDMEKASFVEKQIQKAIKIPASKENVSDFKRVISSYDSLTETQKSYVKSDISKIRNLYQQSKELKNKFLAGIAVATITGLLAGITVGKEEHIKNLKEAEETYESLSIESKKYVDSSIVNNISILLSSALRDKKQREEREEEEERRRREEARRRHSYTSSSTRRPPSSFGGFGGRSGGGGASRGF